MAYIGTSPSNGVRRRFTYEATAGQTSFSGNDENGIALTYVDSLYLDVFQNGIKLKAGDDYTATTGTTVVLVQGASVNDVVEMVSFDVFSVNDSVSASAGGGFAGNISSPIVTGSTSLRTPLIEFTDGDDAIAIADGGVVTFSQTPIGDFNAPYWSGRLASNQTISRTTLQTITGFSTNEIDSSSSFDGTTFTVPSGGAGTYFINATIHYDWGSVGDDGEDNQTQIVHTPSGGSAVTIATGRHNATSANGLNNQTVTATIIFPLGVGDTLIVRAFSADNNGGGGGKALANDTNFGGFRIGA